MDFTDLSADAILRIGKEVSIRQTQEDFVPDGAENVYIQLKDGRRIIDVFASAGAAALGHGSRQLKVALLRSVLTTVGERSSNLWSDLHMDRSMSFASKFNANFPNACVFTAMTLQGLKEVFVPDADCYTVHGTELKHVLAKEIYPWKRPMVTGLYCEGTRAIEAVLKSWYNQRPERTVCLAFSAGPEEGAFSGRTLGSLIFNASKEVHRRHFPKWGHPANPIWIPYPRRTDTHPDADTYIGAVEASVERVLHQYGIARKMLQGVHLELVLGEGGFYEADRDLLYAFEKWRKANNVLLLLDEIQTGMGWTGTLLALEQYPELDPDAFIFGKAITAGFVPLSAAIVRQDFNYQGFGRDSSTFGGYQLGVAAALETVRWMQKTRSWERVKEMGEYMQHRIREVCGRYPGLLDEECPFSGLGMMRGVGFVTREIRDFVKKRAFELGLFVEGTGYKRLRIRPPQIMTRAQFDEVLEILDRALKETDQKFGEVLASCD